MGYLTLLIVLAVQGLLSVNLFITWGLLELGSLLFIGSMSTFYLKSVALDVMKFFLIQAFSGVAILAGMVTLMYNNTSSLEWVVGALLILKMGLIPFHQWFLSLSRSLSWELLYLFLSVQKFLPLYMLSGITSSSMVLISLLSWVVSGLSSMSSSNLKKLLIFSSLFFGGMLLYLLSLSQDWVLFLFAYSVMTAPLFLFSSSELTYSGLIDSSLEGSYSMKFLVWVTLLNLGGLPPLPGFVVKMKFLAFEQPSLYLKFSFIVWSIFLMYMYMSLGLAGLLQKTRLLNNELKGLSLFWGLVTQSLLLYGVLVLWVGVNT